MLRIGAVPIGQLGQRKLAQRERGDHVEAERILERGLRRELDRARRPATGVVHEHVDAAEALERGLRPALRDCGGLGDVAAHRRRLAAQRARPRGGFLDLARRARRANHVGACLAKPMAMPRPMPRPAPVTIATRSVSLNRSRITRASSSAESAHVDDERLPSGHGDTAAAPLAHELDVDSRSPCSWYLRAIVPSSSSTSPGHTGSLPAHSRARRFPARSAGRPRRTARRLGTCRPRAAPGSRRPRERLVVVDRVHVARCALIADDVGAA